MTPKFAFLHLGEVVTEATVATWFKKPGDAVAVDEMLCELETDKVTVEVPSHSRGTMGEIVAAEGETVGVDALLATIGDRRSYRCRARQTAPQPQLHHQSDSVDVMVPTLGESVTEATVQHMVQASRRHRRPKTKCCVNSKLTKSASKCHPQPLAFWLKSQPPEGSTVDASAKLAVISASGTVIAAAPAVAIATSASCRQRRRRRPIREKSNGCRWRVTRSGHGNRPRWPRHERRRCTRSRLCRRTCTRSCRTRALPVSSDDAPREERVKMTRLRQTIARRLKESQNTAAMLTTYNEVDMTEVMALRNEYKDLFLKKHGVKLGFMSFFTKACVHALNEVPEVNAEIDGTDVVYKNFVHMGIAAGTPTGLVVPVIRDADGMSFAGIEKAIAEKGARARDGKLSMAEMQGGTFTISNGGVYGSLMSSPILNPPQSGILGMHKIQDRPMAINGQVVIRPMMYLALSYDHRIVDGKGAVTFLVRVKEALEDPRRLLMDL